MSVIPFTPKQHPVWCPCPACQQVILDQTERYRRLLEAFRQSIAILDMQDEVKQKLALDSKRHFEVK